MSRWTTGMKLAYFTFEFITLLFVTAMGLALIEDPTVHVSIAGGIAIVAMCAFVFWFVSIIFYIMLDD